MVAVVGQDARGYSERLWHRGDGSGGGGVGGGAMAHGWCQGVVYFESTEFTKRLGELGGAVVGPWDTDAIMTAAAMVRIGWKKGGGLGAL